MAISTPKLATMGAILIGSIFLIFFLLYSSIIPQYSVYELYHDNNPDSMISSKVQIIGDVDTIGSGEFVIKDWEGMNYSIKVVHTDVPIPAGFALEKRVMVEGTLHKDGSTFVLDATLISTKCPSKYQSE